MFGHLRGEQIGGVGAPCGTGCGLGYEFLYPFGSRTYETFLRIVLCELLFNFIFLLICVRLDVRLYSRCACECVYACKCREDLSTIASNPTKTGPSPLGSPLLRRLAIILFSSPSTTARTLPVDVTCLIFGVCFWGCFFWFLGLFLGLSFGVVFGVVFRVGYRVVLW